MKVVRVIIEKGVGVYEAWRPSQSHLAVSRRWDKDLLGQTVG